MHKIITHLAQHTEVEYLLGILENIAEGIFVIDTKGIILACNGKAEAMFGYPREEMIDRNVKMLMPEPHHSAHDGYLGHYMDTGESRIIGIGRDVYALRKDGSQFPMRLSISEIHNDDVHHFIGIVHDQSAQKQAEHQVATARERLRLATQAGRIGIWDMNLSNRELNWDHRMFEIYGIDSTRCTADYTLWRQALYPEDRKRTEEHINQAISDDVDFTSDFRIRTPAGEIRYLHAAGLIQHNEAGKPVRLVGMNIDITAQKSLEQRLHQARDEAEQANRAKSAFLANMSHELRTPLNSIIGFSGILESGMAGELNAEQQKQLGIIANSGKHLLDLINDILDLSKIEAGKLEVEASHFDLADLLENSIDIIRPLAEKKSLQLEVRQPTNDINLHSDKGKLKQVLLNLLSNAVKFTDEGHVQLVVEELTDNRLCFAVSDSGRGIEASQLDSVFEEFHQVSQHGQMDKPQGTGLGLAISRKIAHMLGGDISVVSQPGHGSTFSLEILCDLDQETGDIHPLVMPKDELRGAGVILTVEDDPDAQELLRQYLEQDGYRVIQAFSGSQVIEAVRRLKPDLITLDILMPGKNGWQVLHELKNSPATANIPVICISMLDQRPLGLQLGAVEYLSKPIDRRALLMEIEQIRASRSLESILIVDDEPDARELVRNMLTPGDHLNICEAANGREALAMLATCTPDLIITDLMMPEMDGFELLLQLRMRDDCKQTPIIVCTSKSLDHEERQLLQQSSAALLKKSHISPHSLRTDIARLINASNRSENE